MIDKQRLGEIDGQTVEAFRLKNRSGMEAVLINWGAVLKSLTMPMPDGSHRNLVLGLSDVSDYPRHSPYFGATIGRFGNRIGHAQFKLGGKNYKLDANERNRHHLHGGSAGLGRRFWHGKAEEDADGPAVTFSIQSPDGDMGYPGDLSATCTYNLSHDDELRIEMSAQCTAPCPINLVHHSYWNLDGKGTVDKHQLQLNASHYLPTDPDQIPKGEIKAVAGTAFDFQTLKPLDHAGPPEIDFAFLLNPPDRGAALTHAATVLSSDGLCQMQLMTDQQAVQCYSGFKLDVRGSQGEQFPSRSGLCLETEAYPDAPNNPQFPTTILNPGETYAHRMVHKFSILA